MNNKSVLNPRKMRIIELLQAKGEMSIADLALELDVTEQTIRKDVRDLSKASLLIRFHGGVLLNDTQPRTVNTDFDTRKNMNVEEKEQIAAMVADMIPDGSSVFITIGTTVEAVAMSLLDKNITVITDSLRVAAILYRSKTVKVFIPSGSVQSINGGIEGPTTISTLSSFRADYVISSIGGIDKDGTLLDFNISEVAAAQTMINNATHLLLVADHSKFGAKASIKLGDLKDVTCLITDKITDDDIREFLDRNNVRYIETTDK